MGPNFLSFSSPSGLKFVCVPSLGYLAYNRSFIPLRAFVVTASGRFWFVCLKYVGKKYHLKDQGRSPLHSVDPYAIWNVCGRYKNGGWVVR